jgi:hypothetical protein
MLPYRSLEANTDKHDTKEANDLDDTHDPNATITENLPVEAASRKGIPAGRCLYLN